MRVLGMVVVFGCALACGARTPLGVGTTADPPAVTPVCTSNLPWLLFDATRPRSGATGFDTSLAAMRVDGSERHLLGPMAPPSVSSSWFAAPTDGSIVYRASHGGYELRRYVLASGADALLFQRPGSGPSVGPGVLSNDGTRVAYLDWYHLALASSDGTGSKPLVDECSTCVPLAFAPDGAAVWVWAQRALQRVAVGGDPPSTRVTPIAATPALDRAQTRVAAVVQCPDTVPSRSLRIYDLDPNGAVVPTCAGKQPLGLPVATVGGFGNVSRVAWSEDDWLAFDVDAVLHVVSPDRVETALDAGPDVKAFDVAFADACARVPTGPAL